MPNRDYLTDALVIISAAGVIGVCAYAIGRSQSDSANSRKERHIEYAAPVAPSAAPIVPDDISARLKQQAAERAERERREAEERERLERERKEKEREAVKQKYQSAKQAAFASVSNYLSRCRMDHEASDYVLSLLNLKERGAYNDLRIDSNAVNFYAHKRALSAYNNVAHLRDLAAACEEQFPSKDELEKAEREYREKVYESCKEFFEGDVLDTLYFRLDSEKQKEESAKTFHRVPASDLVVVEVTRAGGPKQTGLAMLYDTSFKSRYDIVADIKGINQPQPNVYNELTRRSWKTVAGFGTTPHSVGDIGVARRLSYPEALMLNRWIAPQPAWEICAVFHKNRFFEDVAAAKRKFGF